MVSILHFLNKIFTFYHHWLVYNILKITFKPLQELLRILYITFVDYVVCWIIDNIYKISYNINCALEKTRNSLLVYILHVEQLNRMFRRMNDDIHTNIVINYLNSLMHYQYHKLYSQFWILHTAQKNNCLRALFKST